MPAMQIPEINTDRLLLRAPQAEDFSTYRDFYADAESSAAYGGPLPPHLAWRKLAADLGNWSLRGYGMWSLECRENAAMVGGCGIVWPEGWPRSELTWWIIPSARRTGFALEASRAVITFAYDVLGWDVVETHMDDDNEPAHNLARKLNGVVIARERFPDGPERDIYALPNPAET